MPIHSVNPGDTDLEMAFPLRGLDISDAFDQQAQMTTPVALNVRTFDRDAQRARGGSRPALARYINARVGNITGLIQHLNIIVDPTVAALLDTFDADDDDGTGTGIILDPSDGGRSRGRLVRVGGTGRQPSKTRKKTPVLTWSDPADIRTYVPLTGAQLNATATDPTTGSSVSGTFVYTPDFGYRLGVGREQPLRVTFTPSSSSTYRTVSKKVKINVLDNDLGVITSIAYHGLISSFPYADSRAIINIVKVSINGGADISIGNSGVLTKLNDLGIVGQDSQIFWPDSTDATGTVPPYGYFYVGA